jgi:shikimate dehydrogenase
MSSSPQKSFYTLDDLRHWGELAPALHPPARLAVIGDPVGHSRSPQMHNPALLECGIDAQYIRVQVPPGHVKEALDLLSTNGFIGVNCTIPHKFEALECMDQVDQLARKLGAVNTVHIRNGHFTGYNSDGPGFLRSVKEAFGYDVGELGVLIIGAGGGAGRAVAVQCALEKCVRIVLVNRTPEKARQLRAELAAISPDSQIDVIPWSDEALTESFGDVDLTVNATPIGMKAGDPQLFDPAPIDRHFLIYDMVYKPPGQDTPLIAAAKAVGAKTCNGLSLLLHQGAISFEHWFSQPAPLETMRRGLL